MLEEVGCVDIGCIQVDDYYFLLVYFPFISMECPSLSRLINVGLKSTLSEISIATLPVFEGHWLGKSSSSLSS
jgi:hypothetical protein